MNIFFLLQSISFIFLTTSGPTTFNFDEPIEYSATMDSGDGEVFVSNDRKTITLRPIKEIPEFKPMVFKTKSGVFYFKFKTVQTDYHGVLNIKQGKINRSYSKKFENDSILALEGDTSLMIINKTGKEIRVNDTPFAKTAYFSKGLPILFNGERILY